MTKAKECITLALGPFRGLTEKYPKTYDPTKPGDLMEAKRLEELAECEDEWKRRQR